jgi:hypothetical protein
MKEISKQVLPLTVQLKAAWEDFLPLAVQVGGFDVVEIVYNRIFRPSEATTPSAKAATPREGNLNSVKSSILVTIDN